MSPASREEVLASLPATKIAKSVRKRRKKIKLGRDNESSPLSIDLFTEENRRRRSGSNSSLELSGDSHWHRKPRRGEAQYGDNGHSNQAVHSDLREGLNPVPDKEFRLRESSHTVDTAMGARCPDPLKKLRFRMSADLYQGLTEREHRIKGFIDVKRKAQQPLVNQSVVLDDVKTFIREEEVAYRNEQERKYDQIVAELAKEMEWQKVQEESKDEPPVRQGSPVKGENSQDTDGRNFCVQTIHNDLKDVGIAEETEEKPQFRLG